jgi:hypothetical protein
MHGHARADHDGYGVDGNGKGKYTTRSYRYRQATHSISGNCNADNSVEYRNTGRILMNYQVIPLTSDPVQSLQTTVSVDGENITLQLDVNFNDSVGYWIMKITDPTTNTVLLDSIPLVLCGNILGQYAYLGIGSAYLVNVSNTSTDYPTIDNLSTDFQLVWGDSE